MPDGRGTDLQGKVSRRAVLRAIAAGSVGFGLAACAGATISFLPSASAGSPAASPTNEPTPTPAPTASAAPIASPSPTSDLATLRRKISRLLLVGFRGLEIQSTDPITVALAGGLGGVILFDKHQQTGGWRNISSPDQLSRLTRALRDAAPLPLIVAIDQEGGRVSRLNPAKGFPATRSEAEVGATGDPAVALAAGRGMGRTMAAAGIDLDLAPVVDVNIDPSNPAIGALGRSFSSDPSVVAAMAEAEIRGLHGAGVHATIKHFPGLGSANANTDFDAVDVTATWTEAELEPFQTLIAAGLPDAVMSAHILNRHLDPDWPASLSPATIDGLLRKKLGWNGVVVTDDLDAVAITSQFTRPEAIARAIEAGNDLLTFANQAHYFPDLVAQLLDEIVGLVGSGRISEARLDQSIARLEALAIPLVPG
ncbi:MAG: beta-N-acetylhexosaminidase [Chloroflexota bacterium]|nr:beta-N-acetylhexosaminidase [Chloroflexota bacterium]